MLKENLTIESIAEQRGISVDTIITHLEILQSLTELDIAVHPLLKARIPEADFDIILFAFTQSEDRKLKPIYEKFEGKYSYIDIRIVRLFS